jgi:hypothetical protein
MIREAAMASERIIGTEHLLTVLTGRRALIRGVGNEYRLERVEPTWGLVRASASAAGGSSSKPRRCLSSAS